MSAFALSLRQGGVTASIGPRRFPVGADKAHRRPNAKENTMRHRVRIQPYLSHAEHRRLRAYAAARNLTESAVVEAALVDYFERDATQQALVLRRLEALSQATGHLRRDFDMLSEAVSVFVRFTFLAMPDPPPGAQARANQLYEMFVNRISRQVAAGARFLGEVR